MKQNDQTLDPRYLRLRGRLARLGYISQGSVLDRSKLKSPRSGYQWTRKVEGKTVTVALSKSQYEALRVAIQNYRTLRKILREMERVSREVLFKTLPDTHRRKTLSKRVLGLI